MSDQYCSVSTDRTVQGQERRYHCDLPLDGHWTHEGPTFTYLDAREMYQQVFVNPPLRWAVVTEGAQMTEKIGTVRQTNVLVQPDKDGAPQVTREANP